MRPASSLRSDCAAGYTCAQGTCAKARKVIKIEEREYDFEDDSVEGDLLEPDSEPIDSTEGAVYEMRRGGEGPASAEHLTLLGCPGVRFRRPEGHLGMECPTGRTILVRPTGRRPVSRT